MQFIHVISHSHLAATEREGGREREEDEMFYDLVIGGLHWHTADFGCTQTSRLGHTAKVQCLLKFNITLL